MKLFKLELLFKHARRSRAGVDALVHASSESAAMKRIATKYPGSKVERCTEIKGSVHFVIADIER